MLSMRIWLAIVLIILLGVAACGQPVTFKGRGESVTGFGYGQR